MVNSYMEKYRISLSSDYGNDCATLFTSSPSYVSQLTQSLLSNVVKSINVKVGGNVYTAHFNTTDITMLKRGISLPQILTIKSTIMKDALSKRPFDCKLICYSKTKVYDGKKYRLEVI